MKTYPAKYLNITLYVRKNLSNMGVCISSIVTDRKSLSNMEVCISSIVTDRKCLSSMGVCIAVA